MPVPASQRHVYPDFDLWLEALPAPVLGVNHDLAVVFVNLAAAQLLAGRNLLGKRLEQIFGHAAALAALASRAAERLRRAWLSSTRKRRTSPFGARWIFSPSKTDTPY